MSNNQFAKTICTICFEDLKPNVEDLQSISICGHVFHELCIQQWFEYCTNGKKRNCPVCKQTCSEKNVSRLYFQSVGDLKDPNLHQTSHNCEADPEELRAVVQKLEGKVLGLTSALEQHQKDLKEVNSELYLCKEQVKKEAAMKDDSLKQKGAIQQLLHLKSKELDRSTLECMRLQERSMSLAKELAALKLVSDINLNEEEVLKLASLGNEANNKETIDVLKKSLVIRNKSFKELMAKCNALGRGDARSLRELEKAKEKIRKLQARVQELETAIEVKENGALRGLKGCKKSNSEMNLPNGVDCKSSPSLLNRCSLEDQMKGWAASQTHTDQIGSMPNGLFSSRKTEQVKTSNDMGTIKSSKDFVLVEEEKPTSVHDSTPHVNEGAVSKKGSRQENAFDAKYKVGVDRSSKDNRGTGLRSSTKGSTADKPNSDENDDLILLDDDSHYQPLFNIKKDTSSRVRESQSEILEQPVEGCFSGGLIGPDGNRWHLGKWCKRGQNKVSLSSSAVQGSNPSMGSLIAVGADGRGGRIKVLRSLNPLSLEGKETPPSVKRCKLGAKTSSLQSQGCLQIEHFFGKTGQL